MVWFNVCLLMFIPQVLFDDLLRPAIENPGGHSDPVRARRTGAGPVARRGASEGGRL
jgi:hypothetical protein